jgi:hypothetical protein
VGARETDAWERRERTMLSIGVCRVCATMATGAPRGRGGRDRLWHGALVIVGRLTGLVNEGALSSPVIRSHYGGLVCVLE